MEFCQKKNKISLNTRTVMSIVGLLSKYIFNNYRNFQPHGKGILSKMDGVVKLGIFENGDLV